MSSNRVTDKKFSIPFYLIKADVMIKIVSYLLQLVGVSAGVFVGLTLKSGAPAETHAPEAEAKEAADAKHSGGEEKAKDKKKKEKKAKTDKKGKDDKHGKDDNDSSRNTFVKFSRQFIVPIVQKNGTNALVVLDINLEVSPAAAEKAYAQEPKVRDALLSTLLELSSEGAFSAAYTDQENMTAIRARLLESAHLILNDEVHEVLILSLARQNF